VASSLGSIAVSANWPGGIFTVTVSDTTGLLQTAATADVFTTGEATTNLTLKGNLPALNIALQSLNYLGTAAGSENVWIAATDPQGLQGLSSINTTVGSTANPAPQPTPPGIQTPQPVASAAVVTTPATAVMTAGATQPLPGITLTAATPIGDLTVKVTDSYGLLTGGGGSGASEQGQGTTALTLTGSLAAINAALVGLTYQASTAGTDWLWVSANTAAGPQSVSPVVLTVDPATPVAPITTAVPTVAPRINGPANATLSDGAAQSLSGISLSGSEPASPLTVTISDSTGILHTTASGDVTERGEGSTALTLTGSLAAINIELGSLTYQAATPGTDWLWVSASAGTGPKAVSPVVLTIAQAPPSISSAPLVTTPIKAVLPAGATLHLAGVTVTGSPPEAPLSIRVSDSTGVLNTTPLTGVTDQGEGSSNLTLYGSLTAINTELASLTYQSHSAGTDWLWVSANAATGPQSVSPVVVSVTAPPAVGTTLSSIVSDMTQAMLGLGGGAGFLSATISDSNGALSTQPTQGVTVAGENTRLLNLQGLAASVTAELASLTYHGIPTASATGLGDTLTVGLSDPTGPRISALSLPLLDGHYQAP
jgi:hypothetical protein